MELADLDADGDVDILFANGGLYDSPGPPEPTRVLINDGQARFADRTSEVLGDVGNLARVVKVRDLDADGLVDIVIGNTYQTQSRLFLGRGGLEFEEVTETHLPDVALSVGDLEAGDVDGDGDLDLILADWGPGNPMQGASAPPRLWLNDGSARFRAAPDGAIPDEPRGFSWDIEFIDVDGDLDLDILESCKMCPNGLLLHNDGSGVFVDASDRLPPASNNYEFEPMDVDGDGVLDVVTINDGPDATERLLLGDGDGGFTDATATLWPTEANPSADDNVVVFLDAESDGDPDFIIGSLDGSGPPAGQRRDRSTLARRGGVRDAGLDRDAGHGGRRPRWRRSARRRRRAGRGRRSGPRLSGDRHPAGHGGAGRRGRRPC